MPHAKTGRKVEIGDKVISVEDYGYRANAQAGTVVQITEGSDTCNALVVPFGVPLVSVTLKNCVHIEDLADFKPPVEETKKPTEINGAPVGG